MDRIYDLLWGDPKRRIVILFLVVTFGGYNEAPKNRPWYSRLTTAAITGLGVGAAAGSWRPDR